MNKMSRLRGASAAATTTLLLGLANAGFAASVFESERSILRYVPADSPYVIATGEAFPDDMLDKIEPRVEELLGAYRIAVREIARQEIAENAEGMSPDDMQRMSKIVDELIGLMSIQGLRDAGFERDSQIAVYSHGLLPVIRIELDSQRKFENMIESIEETAGEQIETAEVAGHSYRYLGDNELRFVIGVFDGSVVFAFMPAAMPEDGIRMMLGIDLPKRNVAETSRLADIVDKYDYTEHYVGYVDVDRIARTMLEPPSGAESVLWDDIGDDHPSNLSDICKDEIYGMVGIAPRMVFGYDQVDSDGVGGSLVVEMRDDIAEGLTTIAALVPGLGSDAGGLFSFGASFNLLAMRDFYTARLDAMEADPYECEAFADLQAGVAKGREALAQPLPPFIYSLRGFNAVFDDIVGMDLATDTPPESVDASIVIAMENAQAMLAMGAMMSPELATLQLLPDGNPVELVLPELQAITDAAFAAMTDDALAISVGNGAESRVTETLNADPTEPPPVVAMTMDAGSYYNFLGDAMMLEDEPAEAIGEEGEEGAVVEEKNEVELSPEAKVALRDAMKSLGAIYDRMSVDMRFTGRGIEFDSHVTFKD